MIIKHLQPIRTGEKAVINRESYFQDIHVEHLTMPVSVSLWSYWKEHSGCTYLEDEELIFFWMRFDFPTDCI